MKINKSIILVTGAASGLGEGVVKHLTSLGAFVYMCDLNEKKGKELEDSLGGEEKVKFIKCDVTSETSVSEMFELIRRVKGRIDCLVNSAGILGGQLFTDGKKMFSAELFNKIMNVNLFGTFNVSRFACKLMIDNIKTTNKEDNSNQINNGVIINISSIAASDGQLGQTAYSASKGAVDAMTLPMARDLGRFNIRVCSIAPGIIHTPMGDSLSAKIKNSLISATPLKRPGLPSNIANAVETIIENGFLNGAVIRVDGGIRVPQF